MQQIHKQDKQLRKEEKYASRAQKKKERYDLLMGLMAEFLGVDISSEDAVTNSNGDREEQQQPSKSAIDSADD